MSSSVDTEVELYHHAMKGDWSKVFEMYKQKRALCTTKMTGLGDTVLHMAVSAGKEKVVADMVDFLVEEEKSLAQNNVVVVVTVDGDREERRNSVNVILGAENDGKNTPLHLAATTGNVEICNKIGSTDASLIVRRNIAGETPLFLAALYGRREAFLQLHYLYMESSGDSSTNFAHNCVRDNGDTILHCAIAEEHFDVAIEIVHLYKDHLKEMMKRNNEGLSPLHLLASQPSALSALDHPFYWLFSVKKKEKATSKDELELPKHKRRSDVMRALIKLDKSLINLDRFNDEESSWFVKIWDLIAYLLWKLALLLLLPIFALGKLCILAGRWLYRIRKKKEKRIWSTQIMKKLLQNASDEDMSKIISRTVSEQLSISLQTQEDKEMELGTVTIETPLMIAAKNGVVEMVEEILKSFPWRIKDVNAEGKNIVLLAVEYRQMKVFRFLCKQEWLTASLFGQVDKDGNNALHLAARPRVEPDWLNLGEITWFKFVKKSMPPGLSERYNKKMEIPEDIFRENHKELIKKEGPRLAKTSQACCVVSTLVVSAAFATRTNVPGGYDNEGFATLRNKPYAFKIFCKTSFSSLFWSLLSTIFFLSIVASRPQSIHSLRYVAFKLYLGMYAMFISIILLWVSFCAGDFFLQDDHSRTSADNAISRYRYVVLSLGIVFLGVTQLPTFFGPTVYSIVAIPAPTHKATHPIEYRRTTKKEN